MPLASSIEEALENPQLREFVEKEGGEAVEKLDPGTLKDLVKQGQEALFGGRPNQPGMPGAPEARRAAQEDPMMHTDAQRLDTTVAAGRTSPTTAQRTNPLDSAFKDPKAPVVEGAADAAEHADMPGGSNPMSELADRPAPPGDDTPPQDGASLLDKVKQNPGKLAAASTAAGGAAYLASGSGAAEAPASAATPPPTDKKPVGTPPDTADKTPVTPPKKPTKSGAASADAATTATKTADGPAAATKSIADQLKTDTKEVRAGVQDKLSELDKLSAIYRDEYKANKGSAQWGEVAEKMGHALAQFGAGYQGMKSGLDMSTGLKFDKTDWSHRYEALLGELRVNLQDLRSERGEQKEEGREKVGSLEKGAQIAGEGVLEEAKLSSEEKLAKDKNAKDVQVANIGARSRETTRAGHDAARTHGIDVRASLGDKKLSSKDEADAAGFQTYLDAVTSGDMKAAAANRKFMAAGERLFPGKAAGFEKQAQDSTGFFSSTEAPKIPRTGATAPATGGQAAGAEPPPAPGTVRMYDPSGQPHDVPEANRQKALDKYKWTDKK